MSSTLKYSQPTLMLALITLFLLCDRKVITELPSIVFYVHIKSGIYDARVKHFMADPAVIIHIHQICISDRTSTYSSFMCVYPLAHAPLWSMCITLMCFRFNAIFICNTHTHTHIYIYIYRTARGTLYIGTIFDIYKYGT